MIQVTTKILSLLALVGLSICYVGRVTAAEPPRPNILYFYVDDMGWGSIGPNGQAERRAKGLPAVLTPNLDELARQGVNFTRGYGCHVCSPARSSQQSGFHQGHTFADRNDPDNAKKAMRSDDILMGDALSAAGYATGYWGKWGYGGSKDQVNPVVQNVQTLPTSHGYQHVLAELHHVRAHTFFQPTLWHAPAAPGSVGGLELVANSMQRYRNQSSYPNTPALQSHADYPGTAYCDDSYAFAALDFVRQQGMQYNKSGEPFFGLLAVQIPHAPFGEVSTLPEWDAAYASDPLHASLSDQTKQWAAMVTRIDAHFGNILASLQDPNNDGDTSDSIADNTLVVFQSDNGGPSGKNNVELDANGGLRGVKGSIHEGGIRVPLVMRWPSMINANSSLRAGTSTDRVVDVTDLLPTFCQVAGAETPLGIDGVSVAPNLMGTPGQRNREFLIHEAGNGQSIIRGKHKLIRSGNAKRGGSFQLELYDLDVDRSETNDIAPENAELVKELETLLLGERVAEPRGFANTYHHWTGADGAVTSEPDNWSDYQYANAGKTYMTDEGSPQLSWVARIENTGSTSSTARAESNLEFLGLEVRGNAANGSTQTLTLDPNARLVGRNEIRISPLGKLVVDGSTVSSLRWLDVRQGGCLQGIGTIDAMLSNGGLVHVSGSGHPQLSVHADYQQSADAELRVTLTDSSPPSLQVSGDAVLSGTLRVETGEGFKAQPGQTYPILSAKRLVGKFANENDQLVTNNGNRFRIKYTESSISVVAN